MNRKARINYLKAISHNVERKKMYKAKKQWVVAGISFLVATGMGAIGSHLTTHADTTPKVSANIHQNTDVNQNPQNSRVNNKVNQLAKGLHDKVVNNAATSSNNSGISAKQPKLTSSLNNANKAIQNNTNSTANQRVVPKRHGLSLGVSQQATTKTAPVTIAGHMPANINNPASWGTLKEEDNWDGNKFDIYSNDVINVTGNNPIKVSDMPYLGYYRTNIHKDLPTNKNDWILRIDEDHAHVQLEKGHEAFSQAWGGNGTSNNNSIFSHIKTMDLTGVDTSQVSDFAGFSGDSHLKNLEIGGYYNTHNFTGLGFAFGGCSDLSDIDLSKLDLSHVTGVSSFFSGDTNLKSIVLPSMNINDIDQAFKNCKSLQNVDLSKVNMTSSKSLSYNNEFQSDNNLTNIKLGYGTPYIPANAKLNTPYTTTGQDLTDSNVSHAGNNHIDKSKTIQQGNWYQGTYRFNSDTGDLALYGTISASPSDAKGLDWSKVRHIYAIYLIKLSPQFVNTFSNLPNLESADLTGMDTSNVQSLANLFGNDARLSTITLGNNFILDNIGLTGSFINLDTINSDNPVSLQANQLENGQSHKGTWTKNAEIIRLVDNNNNLIGNKVLQGKFGSKDMVATDTNLPSNYVFTNPTQEFTYSGGITTAHVHLANSDIVNYTNSLINSDYAKIKDLSSADSNDSYAQAQVNSINGDFNSISSEVSNFDANKNTTDSSTANTDISDATKDYENAYSENAAIESSMNTSLSNDNTNLTSASAFISELSGALSNGTSYSSNSALTRSENSVVSYVVSNYNRWNSASNSANSGSTQASINANSFASELNGALNGSTYSSTSSLTTFENSAVSTAASEYSNWSNASVSASNAITSLTSGSNNNSGTISYLASSYAFNAAKSLASNNSANTTTISGIASSVASNVITSVFGNSISASNSSVNSTLASVAKSVAQSIAGNYVPNNSSYTSVVASANSAYSSVSSAFKTLGLNSDGSTNTSASSAVLGRLSAIETDLDSASKIGSQLKSIETNITDTSSGSTASSLSTLNTSINSLNSALGSNLSSASSAISWVESNGTNVSNNAASASTSASSNAQAISSLNTRVNSDENDITAIFDAIEDTLGNMQTVVNGNAQSTDDLQNSYNALNDKITADEASIGSNSSSLSTLNNNLTNEEAILSGDAQNASNLASSANSLATQNSAAVANLKSNTAITVTFMSGNSQVSSPVTLTQGYIESVGSQVSGKSNTYDITSLLNLDVHGYTANNDYQVTLSPNASGVASIAMNSNANNVGGMRGYALNLGTANANSSLGLIDKTSAKNIVNLHGMSIKYTGKVTLNYNVGNNTIKSIQVPYSYLTNVGAKNVNVIEPNNYLNKVINDFDTHNFEYSSESGNNVNEVSPNLIPQSDNTDYESTNPYNVQNALSPVITFTAQPVTENIDYTNDSGSVVGSNNSALSGAVDTQGSVTSANAKSMPANYQLANSDNSFTFTSNGASVNVPVVSTSTNTTNSPENNHSNTTNTKPANMKNVIDVTINDVDGNGNTVRTYNKNITITANQGTSFDLKPQDYLTNGYSLAQNGKSNTNQDIKGEVTANGLTTLDGKSSLTTGTWTFYASKNASDINGSKANKFTPSTNNVPSDNQKPETPVPSTVSDTPSGKNNNNSSNSKAPNNPNNSTNEKNAKNAYATIYIIRRVNGANKSISSKTISENGEPIGYKYTIKPSDKSIQPSGYTVANDDKDNALTGFIQTDGSLSNSTATFYYDVDSSQIEPMEVVYKNDVTHDYINASNGSDLGTSDTGNKAIQSIAPAQLATLGTVGDTVSVKSLLTAPHGYEFSDNNASDYDVTLQKAKQSLGAYVLTLSVSESNNPDSAMSSQSSTVASNMSTANSWADNSSFSDATRSSISNDIKSMSSDDSEAAQFSGKGTAGSNSAQQYFNSASSAYSDASSLATSASASVQSSVSASNSSASASVASLASLVANDVKSNQPDNTGSVSLTSSDIQDLAKDINIQPETNTVVDSSALTSLTNEVATNNSEINSLANKPTPTATVNYNNFDNLINNGIDKLEDTINKDFKANVHEVHAKSVTPKKTIGKRTYSYLKWLRVVKPLKLYNNNHEAVRTIKPRHRITLNVKAAYKVHNHIVFEISYKHHNYLIKANNKAIKNAYLPVSHKLVGRRVRVLYNVYANRRKASGRVKTLHKGYKSTINHIVRIGNHNVTRIQLSNGLWISANMNYVEVL